MESTPRASAEKLMDASEQTRFADDDELSEWTKNSQIQSTPNRRLRLWAIYLLAVSVIANVVLAITAYRAVTGRHSDNSRPRWDEFTLPSPAETAISHTLVKFQNGINSDTTPFQGFPTEANNLLWSNLYSHEMSRISYQEALQLPNKTAPEAPYEGSGYLIVLSVFHNLHCLDSLRKALYFFLDPKWTAEHNPYAHMGEGGIDAVLRAFGGQDVGLAHVDHCIDALRQHEMCAVDVTPNVFQYSPRDFGIRAMANVVHECRDFGKIKQWAAEHRAPPFKGFGDGPAVGKCALGDPTTCLQG